MIDKNINKKYGYSTRSVHSGEKGKHYPYPITTPIYQTSTYIFEDTQMLHGFFQGESSHIAEYGRYGNPTQEAAQNKLKELENAESCLLFSSGMTAICLSIMSICKSGHHIIITNDSYRRTRQFIIQVFSRFGIEYSIVEPEISEIEKHINIKTKLLISESPTNPYLYVLDLEKLAKLCQKHKIKSLIDSTLATPYNQNPLDFGIDIVTHSVTKYLAGHNDVLGGAIFGKSSLINAIQDLQAIMGGVIDPNSAYLIIRGLKTFALRMRQQNESALKIAQFLEKHPKVKRVWYPGLPSHPSYKVALAQMRGFGGLISFLVDADTQATSQFIDYLKIPYIAPSLGGVESLIEQPALMSYYDILPEQREEIGIYGNLVRLSVGIEDTKDIISDIENGLGYINK